MAQNYHVWNRIFNEVFAELLPDRWNLEYDEAGSIQTRGKPRNCTSKFSFTCSECDNKWSSIMATASFWIPFDECKRKRHPDSDFGGDFLSARMQSLTLGKKDSVKDVIGNKLPFAATIYFRLWGQKCKSCTDAFEEAIWPEKEIRRVLENTLTSIKFHVYGIGEQRTYEGKRSRMNAPHEEHLCEACKNGIKH